MANWLQWSDAEDSSSEDDREDLENQLYSQIHYAEDTQSLVDQAPREYSQNSKTKTEVFSIDNSQNFAEKLKIGTNQDGKSTNSQGLDDISPSRQRFVINPLYGGEDKNSSDSDEGIIVVTESDSKPMMTPPAVITLSSDSDSNCPGRRQSRKRNSDFYVARLSSDSEENMSSGEDDSDSSDSIHILDESLKLNIARIGEEQNLDISKYSDEEIVEDTPKKWNQDMNTFYCTYNKENLSDSILLPKRVECDWSVDLADKVKDSTTRSRYFSQRMRCQNCNQMGHYTKSCKEPIKVIRCNMCGVPGHRDTRCPKNCCLGCGQPGLGFHTTCSHCRYIFNIRCKECGFNGHLGRDCPDQWRRYHQTTVLKDPMAGTGILKKSHHFWCCNCGRKGHLIENCRRYLYSHYPITSLKVIKYTKPKELFSEETTSEVATNHQESHDHIHDGNEVQFQFDRRSGSNHDRRRTKEMDKFTGKLKQTYKKNNKKSKSKHRLPAESNTNCNSKSKKNARAKVETANNARQMAFLNRIANGKSKKEKKREKFYNAVLSNKKSLFVQERKSKGPKDRDRDNYKQKKPWHKNKAKAKGHKASNKHLDLSVLKHIKF